MTAPHPRTARPGAGLRILRAAVFAAVCVVLAAAGHTMASCAPVPLWTLGAGFAGSMLLVAPLAGRARSLPGIAVLLALGQTVLHTLFGLGQHTAAGAMTMSPPDTSLSDTALVERAARLLCGSGPAVLTPGHAYRLLLDAHLIDPSGRAVGAMPAMSHMNGATGMDGTAGAAGSWTALLPSLPMLLGHVLAAVVAGWLLRRGDLALLRLIELSAHGVAEAALVRSLRGALALVRALCAGLLPTTGPGPHAPRTARDEAPAPHTTALQHTVIRRGPPAAAFLLAA